MAGDFDYNLFKIIRRNNNFKRNIFAWKRYKKDPENLRKKEEKNWKHDAMSVKSSKKNGHEARKFSQHHSQNEKTWNKNRITAISANRIEFHGIRKRNQVILPSAYLSSLTLII